ncbi:MAG TPA: glutathione S-transferase C-terminal domain-containing protein [Labilithrix sp.]|nr:glutathione S-transferase C-terminal domain-containing protein [Labilithrix sp.]
MDQVTYFRKLASAIDAGLAWLDAHLVPDPERFDYADIAMICMWQHLVHYRLVMLAPLDRYPRLAARVAHLAARDSVASTTPEASLREAAAAGWSPT